MPGQLFEFAVLYHPNLKASEVMEGLGAGEIETKKSELIVSPTHCVAESEEEVRIKAARKIPAEYTEKLDQLEILIRPFGQKTFSAVTNAPGTFPIPNSNRDTWR